MAVHLGPRSPLQLQVLGEEGVRRFIRFGIDRAAAHGYTCRGPVRLWLELMLLFGGRFDDDPLVPPQLHRLLDCSDPDRQIPQAQALHAEACQWLHQVGGPDHAHTRQALARVHELSSQAWTPRPADLNVQVLHLVGWIHPRQLELLGIDAHRRAIDDALAQARERGITTPQGQALFPVLACLVGAGFAHDPLYPWITETLNDPAVPDPDERAARLERRVRTYLSQVVAKLGIA